MANEPVAESNDDLEVIRMAMLQTLDQSTDRTNSAIERKLLFAHDVNQLWYARPELMNAIAASKGEAAANVCLAEITLLFETRAPDRFKRKGRPASRRG
ncbi:MAG: hypothetical protein ABI434_04995 [Burkholderiaceae bacterium]